MCLTCHNYICSYSTYVHTRSAISFTAKLFSKCSELVTQLGLETGQDLLLELARLSWQWWKRPGDWKLGSKSFSSQSLHQGGLLDTSRGASFVLSLKNLINLKNSKKNLDYNPFQNASRGETTQLPLVLSVRKACHSLGCVPWKVCKSQKLSFSCVVAVTFTGCSESVGSSCFLWKQVAFLCPFLSSLAEGTQFRQAQ